MQTILNTHIISFVHNLCHDVFSIGSPHRGWIDPDYGHVFFHGILRSLSLPLQMLPKIPTQCSTGNWFDTDIHSRLREVLLGNKTKNYILYNIIRW